MSGHSKAITTAYSLLFLISILVLACLITQHNIASASFDPIPKKVTVMVPTLLDMNGKAIDTVTVGQQTVARTSLFNNLSDEQPFVLIVELRDANGVTQHLAWQSGTVGADGGYEFETSWTPTELCDDDDASCSNFYQIRSFAISDMDSPELLSTVAALGDIVVTGS